MVTERPAAEAGTDRTAGRVLWFSHKGFGFIRADDGTDVYVHHSAIAGRGFLTLPADARVTFVVVGAARGPEAAEVRIVDER